VVGGSYRVNGWWGSSLPSVRTSATGRQVGQRLESSGSRGSCCVCCRRSSEATEAGQSSVRCRAEFAVPRPYAPAVEGRGKSIDHERMQVTH
jgi:hypothetical protein